MLTLQEKQLLEAFRRMNDDGQQRSVTLLEYYAGVFPRSSDGVVNITDFRRASGRALSTRSSPGQVCSIGEPGKVVLLPVG